MLLNKILIINVAGIGDLVRSVPAIRALRKGYPDSYIAVLTSPRCIDVLKGCPYINDIFTLKSILKLRRMRFDIAINLYQIASISGAIKMKWLLRLIRPKLTAGRNTDGRGGFFTFKIQDYFSHGPQGGYRHEVETVLEIVKMVGAIQDGNHLELWIDRYEQDKVEGILKKNGIEAPSIIVGISPGSYQASRVWRYEYFARVGDYIADRHNVSVLIVGDRKDRLRAREISRNMKKRCVIVAGRLNLRLTIAIIARCRVFIANDTGLMYIAVALGVPVVVIFGPSNPKRFGPYGDVADKHIVVQKGKDINTVGVDDVIKAVDIQMKRYAGKD